MGAIFNPPPTPGLPPVPLPPPPAANPPTYASSRVQGAPKNRAASGVPGFGDTVKTDAFGGAPPTTQVKQLMGA